MVWELPRVPEILPEGIGTGSSLWREIAQAEYTELLLGCGHSREKRLGLNGQSVWHHLVTLDHNPNVSPDMIWDLDDLPLPFQDNSFDELHAYEVLEHCGHQGDWQFFFQQFDDFHRILKPGGFIFATTPSLSSPWTWADPGHRRSFSKYTLMFLSQAAYAVGQAGVGPGMTDYRWYYKADFDLVQACDVDDQLRFVLRARK